MKAMTTREKLLGLLEENREAYLSGEELAKALAVSRAAVWKAVKSLQQEGYPIDAVTNRGYRLSRGGDRLSAPGIRKYLKPEYRDLPITVEEETKSTNTALRAMAEAGAPEGTVYIAQGQTGGRGRMGRSFFSPAGTGLYLSLLLIIKQNTRIGSASAFRRSILYNMDFIPFNAGEMFRKPFALGGGNCFIIGGRAAFA